MSPCMHSPLCFGEVDTVARQTETIVVLRLFGSKYIQSFSKDDRKSEKEWIAPHYKPYCPSFFSKRGTDEGYMSSHVNGG